MYIAVCIGVSQNVQENLEGFISSRISVFFWLRGFHMFGFLNLGCVRFSALGPDF